MVIYRLRRKLQQAASYVCGKAFLSKVYYRINVGEKLNLKSPKAFTEKLQWLKLYYCPNEPKVIQCADKYRVRDYIESIGEGQILNELIGVFDSADDIDWDSLPDSFVLKCNHGCGYNIICPDKSKLDIKEATKKLNKWMKEDYSRYAIEPHYSKIQRKIVCEKYLGDKVVNYNIYCLNEEPVFFSLISGLGDGVDEKLTYYYVNGEKAEFKNGAFETDNAVLSEKLPEMVEYARKLSKGFPMVRVDLFDIEGRIILSEMTFTPGSAFLRIEPYSADIELGKKLNITI